MKILPNPHQKLIIDMSVFVMNYFWLFLDLCDDREFTCLEIIIFENLKKEIFLFK